MKNTVRKLILFSAVVITLVSLFSFHAFAEAVVAVASAPFQTHQGETFTTTIYIPDNADIVDFDITLKYDTENLTLSSIEENEDVKGSVSFNADVAGIIKLNYTRTKENVVSYMPIVDVEFTVDNDIGYGTFSCFEVDASAAYVAHRLTSTGTLEEVEFECDFAPLVIYEMGDVDLNRKVDIGDATCIRRHLAGIENAILDDFKLTLADTYFDRIIDIGDAVTLQRHLANSPGTYGNRVVVTFYDIEGKVFATKSVVYGGTLHTIPNVPENADYADGVWSASTGEVITPNYVGLTENISVYPVYSEKPDEAMTFYKGQLSKMYYSGDMPGNMSSDLKLVDQIYYQSGMYGRITYASDCNYVLNSTTGAFTKPTYPQSVKLTASIISYNADDSIRSEDSVTFDYAVKGIFVTPEKEEIEDFLKHYLSNDNGEYEIAYDVKLLSSITSSVLPGSNTMSDSYVVRIEWYQNVNGTLEKISQVKRTAKEQINDYVAIATFNGAPVDEPGGDGKIYFDDVTVSKIEQIEIKDYIVNEIAASQGTLATNNTELWNNDKVYGTTVRWETGNADIAYVENNVIKLDASAVSGMTLPLNARVSYSVGDDVEEFVLAYNLTVSCNNTVIKAPENMDDELYRALKNELEENLGFRGDLTSEALANVKFVNLDLSGYPEISSLRGLSYCKNLRTLNISGLHITDGTMNQISTLTELQAFVARNCGLDNLSDGGTAVLRNATKLSMIDLTDNNFTSLDSVFAEGIRYGYLREVYLSNNQLEDINALSRAPIMTYLSLSGNGLTTEGTASLEGFTCLKYLSLSDNEIDSVEHLKPLVNLQELRLFNNKLTNVNDLRRLLNLEILYLGHNEIKDVTTLNILTKLKILYLNDNQISDISTLNSLSDLEVINVNNNSISSLSVLSAYKSTLTEIYAENNLLTDFSFINSATNLRFLMLSGNKTELTQTNMTSWLSGLADIQVLTLSGIRLTDLSFLDGMTELVRLDVADCGLHAFSDDVSNIQQIANRYELLRALDVSDNDFSDGELEIEKLKDVTQLVIFYANNICNSLDANTLTYSMTELEYISLENCGITSATWLSKLNSLKYVNLAGNKITAVDLSANISNASKKTIEALYLDTSAKCSFASAWDIADYNVTELSLAGMSVDSVRNLPVVLDNIKYINLDGTGITNLRGEVADMEDVFSIERYTTLNKIDVSHLEADISPLETMENLNTVVAVGQPYEKSFFKDNLHSLQRMYNAGITCYLYNKDTEYKPVAKTEGEKILALINDFSCEVIIAADKIISDNNPELVTKINDYDITWSVSNNKNYELKNNRLAVKDYTGIEDETLIITASIKVYPDQDPVTREFTIDTRILRAAEKYINLVSSNSSESMVRGTEFVYDFTLQAAQTDGFADNVKPVEDNITYTYAGSNEIPYAYFITETSGHNFIINTTAPLNEHITITVDITHITKDGNTVSDYPSIIRTINIPSRTFKATFVVNGGTLSGVNGESVTERDYVEDDEIFKNLTLGRAGYVFKGWYNDEGLTDLYSATGNGCIMPGNDITLYAMWDALSYNISFDANGGIVGTDNKEALSDVAIGELPEPTRTNYQFDGWFTQDVGGDQVTAESVFARTDELKLYAHWTLNTFTVTFDANGGRSSETSRTMTYGYKYGTLPTPTKDYCDFTGWYMSNGTKVTSDTVFYGTSDITLTAGWSDKPVKGWIAASSLPSGAKVTNRKWSYTQTSTTESYDTSMSGWTQIGSYWAATQSGAVNYASFPSGFDTSHWIYQQFAKEAYSSYENATSKRDVSNAWGGYVYWHWMYNTSQSNGIANRAIYNKKGTGPDNNFWYGLFGAFTTTNGDYKNDTGYCNSLGIRNYIIPERTSFADCQGATRWFRFDFYVSSYTDYIKVFQYQKTENLESSYQVYSGGSISNVQEWVMYQEK